MAQEKLQVTIPLSNKWHNEDIEAKAKELGMDKSEFVLKAVDMMMNFDTETFQKIKEMGKGLNIPEWLIMQNLLINTFADKAANRDINGNKPELLKEIMGVYDGETYKLLTGEPLYNRLKESYIDEYQKEKDNKELLDNFRKREMEHEDYPEWKREYYRELEEFKKDKNNKEEDFLIYLSQKDKGGK